MGEKLRTIYLENAWPALVTDTARRQFEKAGWIVDGNWLNRARISPSHRVILAAPAHFDGASIVNPANFPESRVWSHLIFPDEVVGWDFQKSQYAMRPDSDFIPLLESVPVLSHSNFTLNLATEVYAHLHHDRRVTYLPIEFDRINLMEREDEPKKRRTQVLWNHMWRSDKGIFEALSLIEQLSGRYPGVEFNILRNNDWGTNPDVEIVKAQSRDVLLRLRSRENVHFYDKFPYYNIENYWRLLASQDIGFSVSCHEGFGLSMLEQQAAGVAIVVPNDQSYHEIHNGALITDQVGEGISTLIENHVARLEVSQAGIDNAAKFNAQDWVKRILSIVS